MTFARQPPPTPVLIVIAALVLLVPFASWTWAGLREWASGGSQADQLTAPYWWGVLWFRVGGAFLLAIILWRFRTSASVWIALTSVWIAGPPLQMLLVGIEVLAVSGGERSLPSDPIKTIVLFCVGPAIVTLFLVGFRSSRRAYGLESVPENDPFPSVAAI